MIIEKYPQFSTKFKQNDSVLTRSKHNFLNCFKKVIKRNLIIC